MGYTRRQIDRILNHNGKPVINPDSPLPYSQRITESFIRRRLFNIEDRAAVEQFAMVKQANRDIRSYALDVAQRQHLSTLAVDGASLAWTRAVSRFMQGRFIDLSRELLSHTLGISGDAYLYSFYGRGWVLDMSTKRDIRVKLPLPERAKVTRAVVQPGLSEAFNPDFDTLLNHASEWTQRYTDVLDDVTRKMRGQWSTAQVNGESVLEGLQRLSDRLGTSSDGSKGAAGMLGTLTRSTIQSSATQGSKAVYEANDDLLVGVMFAALPGACAYCAGLDGTRWPLGDPDIVYPVSQTHPNCRCSLIGISASEAEIDSDLPPDFSWSEWLRNNNINFLADEFAGSAMDTEQV